MSDNHTILMTPEDKGFHGDRATVVIQAHYQEFDPNVSTYLHVAFDRTLPAPFSPTRKYQKVSPQTRKPLDIGDCEWGKVSLVLQHSEAKMGNSLLELQKSNIIRIFNAAGDEIAFLPPNEGCTFNPSGPLFVESTVATAILQILAMPR